MIDNQLTMTGRASLIGSLRVAQGTGVVHIEDCFDTSIGNVWSALVDPQRRARRLGNFEGQLQVGGHFRAHFLASEWEGSGRVEMCEFPRHLLVSLTEAGATESHVMEVMLADHGVVEDRGIPPEQLAAYGAGVQIHVEDLVSHLFGGERCDAQARWKVLFPSYKAKPVDAV
jgi:uncharacterized protein YndB with AHSA1/START domain